MNQTEDNIKKDLAKKSQDYLLEITRRLIVNGNTKSNKQIIKEKLGIKYEDFKLFMNPIYYNVFGNVEFVIYDENVDKNTICIVDVDSVRKYICKYQ